MHFYVRNIGKIISNQIRELANEEPNPEMVRNQSDLNKKDRDRVVGTCKYSIWTPIVELNKPLKNALGLISTGIDEKATNQNKLGTALCLHTPFPSPSLTLAPFKW